MNLYLAMFLVYNAGFLAPIALALGSVRLGAVSLVLNLAGWLVLRRMVR